MAPLRVETRERMQSRRLALVEATLSAPDGPCARASGLFLAAPDAAQTGLALAGPEGLAEEPLWPARPSEVPASGFARDVRVRWTRGLTRGHALWIQCRRPLFTGRAASPLQRAAAAADFTTAVAVLVAVREGRPPAALINADTSLYLARAPVGGWLGFELEACDDAGARGLCAARIFDRQGALGRSLQASVAARRA